MKYLFAIAAFLCLALLSHQQNQDLCGATGTWVNDPSHCSRYLYCRRDPDTSEVISVHQMDCRTRPGGGFDFFDEPNCVNVDTNCPDDCPNPTHPTWIGLNSDETCRTFFHCQFPTITQTCGEGLVFNRATGQCDTPENAPCFDEPPVVEAVCPRDANNNPTINGFFPGSFCWEFIVCVQSAIVERGACGAGQAFVPNDDPLQSGSCQLDPTCVHPSVSQAEVVLLDAPTLDLKRPKPL